MKDVRRCFKRFLALIIAFSIPAACFHFCPVAAGAEEAADVPLTDDDFDDDEDYDDEEDYEDEYGIDDVLNFMANSISAKSVKLKWDKAEEIDGYELSYKAASSSKWITKELSASRKSVKVSGLKENTKYNFRIRAFIHYEDDDEDYDDEDDIEYTDDSFVEEDFEDDEEFDDLDEYEYGEYSKMNLRTLTKDGSGDRQAFSDKYEYSADKSVKVPVLKKIKSKGGKVDITWKKSKQASGYEVYISKKAKSRFKCVSGINKAETVKYTSKRLKKGVVYYFKVRAYVKSGSDKLYTKYSKTRHIKVK